MKGEHLHGLRNAVLLVQLARVQVCLLCIRSHRAVEVVDAAHYRVVEVRLITKWSSNLGEIQIAMDCTLIKMVVDLAAANHISALIMPECRWHATRRKARNVHSLINRPVQQAHFIRIYGVHMLLVVGVDRLVPLQPRVVCQLSLVYKLFQSYRLVGGVVALDVVPGQFGGVVEG